MGKSRLVAEFVRMRAATRAVRRVRRVPVVRHEHDLLRLARDLATLFRLDDGDPEAEQRARARRRARGDRPGAGRRAPRCSRPSSACRSRTPTLTRSFDAKLRKTSLEDLLATACARAAPTRAARARARGLPLDRRAVARPARRPGPGARRACPCCSSSPTDRPRAPAAGSASSSCRTSASSCSTQLGATRRAELDPLEARAAVGRTVRTPSRRRARRAGHRALRGNPFYVEELLNYVARPGRRPARRAAPSAALELPDSLHSLVLSRIDTLRRGAAPDAQGRERRRARLPGAGAAGRLPRARDRWRRSTSTSTRCARPTSSRSTGRPTRRTSSSTS